LLDAVVWSATSPDREFRDKTWSSVNLGKSAVSNFTYEIALPASGYQAFYIDLKYKAPVGGEFHPKHADVPHWQQRFITGREVELRV
jgi:hypothetical protein